MGSRDDVYLILGLVLLLSEFSFTRIVYAVLEFYRSREDFCWSNDLEYNSLKSYQKYQSLLWWFQLAKALVGIDFQHSS